MISKDMWTCPKCGRKFANRNQSHACGQFAVEQHFNGKPQKVVSLYKRLVKLVEQCGPVTIAPTKSRIGFQVRMVFAAVSFRDSGLACHVVLSRRLENSRFIRIQSLSPRNHVHHFRIRSVKELDDEVFSWLQEAYRVGEQKHRIR
jgi:hypothetical protein